MELGSRLKEAREAKGLSLDSLQETTKIQKRYLVAIEEANFQVLPGKFYARAFIKEYALAVGIDPNELLEEFKDEIPNTVDEDATQYTRIHRSRKDSNPSKSSAIFSLIPTIIVVLLVIGIIFFAWFFYQKTLSTKNTDPVDKPEDNEFIIKDPDENQQDTKENDDQQDTNEKSNDEEQTDDTPAENEEPEFHIVEKGTGSIPESTVELNNAGEKITITLESDGKTYLDVKNENGDSFFSGMFTADQSPKELDLTGAKRVYFNIGRATEFQATINGVVLELPVDPKKYVNQHIWVNINQTAE